MNRSGSMKMGKIIKCMTVCVLAATFTTAALPPPSKIAWENPCATSEGWFFNAYDPSTNTRVDKSGEGVVKITQDGPGTWGKAFCTVSNVDVQETPILELKVDKVDLDSAFQVAIAPSDWSEMLVVIKRTSAHGIHRGDLQKAIRDSENKASWENSDTFNVVVIIEGKSKASFVDYVRIQSKM